MLLLTLLSPPAVRQVGRAYLALPNVASRFEAGGKPADPSQVAFRELVFAGRDPDGRWRFLRDGKTPLSTRADDPFRADGLRPPVETPRLAALRRRYEGKTLWSFGYPSVRRRTLGPESHVLVDFGPAQPVGIARIVQFDRVPARINGVYNRDSDGYRTSDYGRDALFLVVYRLGPRTGNFLDGLRWKGSGGPPKSKLAVTPAYRLILGDWRFERLFSTSAPTARERRAVQRTLASSNFASRTHNRYVGLTHRQLAWAMGWPMERTPLDRLRRQTRWVLQDRNYFGFKGDRVVSYDPGLPY